MSDLQAVRDVPERKQACHDDGASLSASANPTTLSVRSTSSSRPSKSPFDYNLQNVVGYPSAQVRIAHDSVFGKPIGDAMTNDEEAAPETLGTAPQPRPRNRALARYATFAVAAIVFIAFEYVSALPRRSDAWAEFIPDSGEFSVSMRGTPTETHETRAIASLTLTMRAFKTKAAGHSEECTVAYYDFSEPMRQLLGSEQELLDTMCEGLGSGKGERNLFTVDSINLASHPGRELVCERPQIGATAFARIRIYLVGRRLYVLTFASWNQPRLSSREAEIFFSSFKLIENSPAGRAEVAAPRR
ncbi:MAG TPA: hypothetical protein VG055_20685 [Planctomycetaceae bacterium]|jgi:hypothetical protein|nr:hypothetical protein [Planctomycetaceae bacterium]